jgi:transposase
MRSLVLMEVSSLLFLPEGLRIEWIEPQAIGLSVGVSSTRASSFCPLCAQASSHVHSQYQRILHDVPSGGRKIILHLCVRKFFCRNPDCGRKIFTERLPAFVEPWARVTNRLFEAVQTVGLATSGELGARLSDRLGIHTSPTTILRRIMALPFVPVEAVLFLGIDDFSFRRGRKFGTILVDLTSHQILDLLPDRTAEMSAAWMRKHPEIEIVSRDRGEEYAAAAGLGAPQAVQCADRFHLAQNLTEIAEVILASCRAEIRKAVKTQLLTLPEWPEAHAPLAGNAHLAHHAERTDRYQQLIELRKAGLTLKEIARRLGMGERTVRYWLTRGIPYAKPELRHKRHRRGLISTLIM